jgi:hypothetical protein
VITKTKKEKEVQPIPASLIATVSVTQKTQKICQGDENF